MQEATKVVSHCNKGEKKEVYPNRNFATNSWINIKFEVFSVCAGNNV